MLWLKPHRWLKIMVLTAFVINGLWIGQMAQARVADRQDVATLQKKEDKSAPKDENLIKFILFVTIDGLADENLVRGYTPNLNGLAGSGVKTRAISVFPADSQTAVATIMTGASPDEHNFKTGLKSKIQALPDLIAVNNHSVVIVDGKNGLSKGLTSKVKLITSNQGDKETTDLAIKEFEKNKPYFMHVILSGVDQANRKYGVGSPKQLQAVEEADKQVGRLLGKMHEYGLYQYSVVVVSGSYGVTKQAAGSKYTANSEVTVPLYIKAPTVEAGITAPVAELSNIAPTVAYLLGLKTEVPKAQVLWNILKNEGGSSESYLLKKRVNDMADALVDATRREFGLAEEKMRVLEEKNQLNGKKAKYQSIIEAKDQEIKSRDRIILALKGSIILLVLLSAAGYLFEFRMLKKKFLMFK